MSRGIQRKAEDMSNHKTVDDRLAIDGGPPASARYLFFGQPCFGREEEDAVVETLRSGWVGMGVKCQEFEREFGTYLGNPRSVSVSSCTAALHLSLLMVGVKPGQEVITTPLTFAATANSIEHVGATPVFADIDPATWNLDPRSVETRISSKTAAILPVHFGGMPCDLTTLQTVAGKHGLPIVEDAAHALGARFGGRPIGQGDNFVCFSFYANKNLTTVEGGMLCCPREDWADRARSLRVHGLGQDAWARFQTKELILSRVLEPGFKYNLTDLQAAIGLVQLRKFESMQTTRGKLAAEYDQLLHGIEGLSRQFRPVDDPATRHALHLYAVAVDLARFRVSRNELVRALRAENVGVGIHYEPLVQHPFYRERYGFQDGDFPVAERIGNSALSLPISPTLSGEDVKTVAGAIRKVLAAYRKH